MFIRIGTDYMFIAQVDQVGIGRATDTVQDVVTASGKGGIGTGGTSNILLASAKHSTV